jgi:hypothetical protein
VFGSDTYSSWTGIRDWLVANIQQTDTIQQFLAYEKCYVPHFAAQQLPQLRRGARADGVHQRLSAHGKLVEYPERQLFAGGRAHPGSGKTTHVPGNPDRVLCVNTTPPAHVIRPVG